MNANNMHQLTINVSSEKLSFFMELMAALNFTATENTHKQNILTEEQMSLVLEEQEKYHKNPEDAITWEEARKNFKFKR